MEGYVLFEKNCNGDNNICNWDVIRVVDSERLAMAWVNENVEYRTYKYCPNVCVN